MPDMFDKTHTLYPKNRLGRVRRVLHVNRKIICKIAETTGTLTTGGLRYCQTAKSEAIFLTMLVHKNQARKHLKRDVPNLVL